MTDWEKRGPNNKEEQAIVAGGINGNLAPDAFSRWASHYYLCCQMFQPQHDFSPVPYFLLCRAIELAIKARHLVVLTQEEVKRKFGHDLLKAYMALSPRYRVLTTEEENVLKVASKIYGDKGFEYFDAEGHLTAFKSYPRLDVLDVIAQKMVSG